MTKHDAVNHPSHYTAHPSGVECITITEHMTFNAGNAVKYLWRAGLKVVLGATPFGEDVEAMLPMKTLEKHIEDLKKGRWYVDREISRLERQRAARQMQAQTPVENTGCAGPTTSPRFT